MLSVIINLENILTYSYLENSRFIKNKYIILESNRGKNDKMDLFCFR